MQDNLLIGINLLIPKTDDRYWIQEYMETELFSHNDISKIEDYLKNRSFETENFLASILKINPEVVYYDDDFEWWIYDDIINKWEVIAETECSDIDHIEDLITEYFN